jgi:hypothetical protein
VVGAGSGLFLARELAARSGRHFVPFDHLAGVDPAASLGARQWANTCAPSVAIALLFDRWSSSCG